MADYDIPTPDQIADTLASDLEEQLKVGPDGTRRVIDARSPRSVLAAIGRATALALYEVYVYLSWILKQVFPDSCDDAILPLHARVWGVERLGATKAVGRVVFSGAEGTALPSGTRLTLSGASWITTAPAVVDGDLLVTVPVEAVDSASAGNAVAGAKLALVTPIVGLAEQSATVDAGGISGGADIETIASWRARLLDHIREPAHGGANHDYARWVKQALPGVGRVTVYNAWVGAGSVGVVIAMPDPVTIWRAPTEAEIAVAQTYLGTPDAPGVAPVTAEVVVVAAVPKPIAVTATVSPFSTTVEAAVKAAAIAWFGSADNKVGATLHLSRLQERLSRAAGEDWHELTAPATKKIVLAATEIAVPGVVSVGDAT